MAPRTRSSTGGRKGAPTPSLWLAPNAPKRFCELVWLAYSPCWIVWALCIVVPFRLYESFTEWGYMYLCVGSALPCLLLPWALEKYDPEAHLPLWDRYWVRANVWVAIFSHIGNYFWTHYFYQLLGAKYTFPSWRLNDVPIPLYFMTHAYFCFYHALSNVVLRRWNNALRELPGLLRHALFAAAVIGLSYATAFGETLTIAAFPYYTFTDKAQMYRIGSLFYALYFVVSFPLFLRMDEDPKAARFTLSQAAMDSLGAGMLVTICLDAWRLSVGAIAPAFAEYGGSGAAGRLLQQSGGHGLPFMKG